MIHAAGIPDLSWTDFHELVRYDLDLPEDTWVADGVRACDSPNRTVDVVSLAQD